MLSSIPLMSDTMGTVTARVLLGQDLVESLPDLVPVLGNRTMTGLDVLVELNFAPIRNQRVGLVTHPAARSATRVSTERYLTEQTQLSALFGPEHGFTGEAQDLIPVRTTAHSVPIYSLYGDSFDSLRPTRAMLRDLDVLVIDLVDVGSRYYTFQATMLYCLEACSEIGLPALVLDRPNPIGGAVEGPTIRKGFESFVGAHPIAIRHGMTMGELALLYKAERVPKVDLTVVRGKHWRRSQGWKDRFWLPPSPNMPTVDTARVYPGMCLIEGTNLSEGRGTTRPFEYIGHPKVHPHRLVDRLQSAGLPGVDFLPVHFRPTFQKHANQGCGGVFVVPTHDTFQPVRTGLAMLIAFRKLLGDSFQWRTERYEFVDDIPAIDLLMGSDREREKIEAGASWQEIAGAWAEEEEQFCERRKPYLLYSS
jgi:uncharacterized protein YbbC (DUF1343 family)